MSNRRKTKTERLEKKLESEKSRGRQRIKDMNKLSDIYRRQRDVVLRAYEETNKDA